MEESEKEVKKRALRELEGKNIAYYSVLLKAWIETKMERDKTLVTLSSAAIGLLVTLLTTVGTKNFWEIPLFAISVSGFLVTIWSSLKIYQLNSQHIEEAINGSSKRNPLLEKYDKLSIRAFIFGSIIALLIGIVSSSYKLKSTEVNTMAEKQKSSHNAGEPTMVIGSLNGVTNLKPGTRAPLSVDGITNLKPQASQTQNQTKVKPQAKGKSGGSSSDGDKK